MSRQPHQHKTHTIWDDQKVNELLGMMARGDSYPQTSLYFCVSIAAIKGIIGRLRQTGRFPGILPRAENGTSEKVPITPIIRQYPEIAWPRGERWMIAGPNLFSRQFLEDERKAESKMSI